MHKNNPHALAIIAMQRPNGSWGQFHSLSKYADSSITTEQALRRLEILGYTDGDECIDRAVGYMARCLRGNDSIPDPREKTHDWDIFTELMLAARIRRFTTDVPEANAAAAKWAKVIQAAFVRGEYRHERYLEAFADCFKIKPKGGRIVDFVQYYIVSLMRGCLDPDTERAFLRYVIEHQNGIYYVYEAPLNVPPHEFCARKTSYYIAALELIAPYETACGQLGFAADWLDANRSEDGTWDMGSAANDKICFPLSDNWRKKSSRIGDCTERLTRLYDMIK